MAKVTKDPTMDDLEKYYQELVEAVEAPSIEVPHFDTSQELLVWLKSLKYTDFNNQDELIPLNKEPSIRDVDEPKSVKTPTVLLPYFDSVEELGEWLRHVKPDNFID